MEKHSSIWFETLSFNKKFFFGDNFKIDMVQQSIWLSNFSWLLLAWLEILIYGLFSFGYQNGINYSISEGNISYRFDMMKYALHALSSSNLVCWNLHGGGSNHRCNQMWSCLLKASWLSIKGRDNQMASTFSGLSSLFLYISHIYLYKLS